MIVREARPDELDAALALRRAVFADEQHVEAAREPDVDDLRATHLVAVEGFDVVGTCRLVPSEREPGRLRLGYLAVARAVRGHGIGSAIVDEALARALAAGFDTVVLHADPRATRLYERAGFARIGEREVAGLTLVTMQRRIHR